MLEYRHLEEGISLCIFLYICNFTSLWFIDTCMFLSMDFLHFFRDNIKMHNALTYCTLHRTVKVKHQNSTI